MWKTLALLLAIALCALAEPQTSYGQGGGQGGSPDNDGAAAAQMQAMLAFRQKFMNVRTAHAACLGLAFVLWYPLGAFIMRLLQHKWTLNLHIGVMLLAVALSIAGMGLGIWMATSTPMSFLGEHHAIIGLLVLSLMILQPVGGILAHRVFKSSGGSNRTVGFAHAWWGRALLVLGAINGAFGLQLAENNYQALIAYAVLMSLVIGSYLIITMATKGYKPGGRGFGRGREVREKNANGSNGFSA